MELLSVIVPVYNSEKYLNKCVESILSQTYPRIELILVDDGSTDNSGFICDTYAQKYENVVSIHQMNGGITKARLNGVKCAKGKHITFVDSDDWIDTNFYSTMCEDGMEYDLIISGIYRYYDAKTCFKETNYCAGIYDKGRIAKEVIPNMLWDFNKNIWALDPSLCVKIFNKDKLLCELEKVQRVGSLYGEDSMVLFPMMFHVEKMKVVEDAFYYHRQRPKGEFPHYIKDEMFLEKLHSVYMYLKTEFQKAGYYDLMCSQLEHFYFKSIKMKERSYGIPPYYFFTVFPFEQVEKDSRVILYGAGKMGKNYMEQNLKYGFCNIIHWVDKNYENIPNDIGKISSPNIIEEEYFDYIVIAIDKRQVMLEIKNYLIGLSVPREKIIWHSVRRCIEE